MFWVGLLAGTGITLAVMTAYGMRLRSTYRLEPRAVQYRHRTTDIAAEVEQIVRIADAERRRYFEIQEARAVELCHCHGYDPADDDDDMETNELFDVVFCGKPYTDAIERIMEQYK